MFYRSFQPGHLLKKSLIKTTHSLVCKTDWRLRDFYHQINARQQTLFVWKIRYFRDDCAMLLFNPDLQDVKEADGASISSLLMKFLKTLT